jgi:DNA-3-methyladenine glycosylase
LLGAIVVSDASPGRTAARIVETEAYLPGDAAAHSFRGMTARNRALFMRRGHAYVYFIYGSCFCLNVSGDADGVGAGVLLRAAEPVEGIGVMRLRRASSSDRDLCRGPGRLAAALGVDRTFDGLDLTAPGPLWLAAPDRPATAVGESSRIGVTKETERLLRFYERGSPYLSGTRSRNR